MKKPFRIYVDTSVFGGCLDDAFKDASLRFFESVRAGRIILVLSSTVIDELEPAPEAVKAVLTSLPVSAVEQLAMGPEVAALAAEYLKAGVLTPKSANDALHVAAATIGRADAIVSWNFKHIVHLDKMKGFNRVNYELGYGSLTIVPPMGVIDNDGQDE